MGLTFVAGPADAGKSVYTVLRRELLLSAGMTRRLKQAGAIFVGGTPVYTDYVLKPGDTLTVSLHAAEPPCDVVPESGLLAVLFENEGLLAVNKPAGLLTHPSRARYTGTLANFAAGYLLETTGDGSCHAVNRLDRDTSGVVLFAKNSHYKALGSAALQEPDAQKEYLALVYGVPQPAAGTIDLPIKRLREGDMLRGVAPDGQRAVTHYESVGYYHLGRESLTLLHLTLETGRTHQIRVHCEAIGHPILGDKLYGTTASAALSARVEIETQALHARRLTFTEPISKAPLVLEAPAPAMFELLSYCF